MVGTGLLEEFTAVAQMYKQSVRAIGGYWDASWEFPFMHPELDSPVAALARRARRQVTNYVLNGWYESRLGAVIKGEAGGSLAWEGLVWSMELTIDGWTERISLEDVVNRCKAVYTTHNASDELVIAETGWFENATSMNRYGYMEEILVLDQKTQEEAEAEAQRVVNENAEPMTEPITVDSTRDDGLLVQAVGRVFTAQRRYVTVADGSDTTVSAYINDLLTSDTQFLSPAYIATNSLPAKKILDSPMRVWDKLLDLVLIGDASFNPYVLRVGPDGRTRYEPGDNTVRYGWHGRAGGIQATGGGFNPWLMQPGTVIRNMKREGRPLPSGSFLQMSTDAFVSEVGMAQGEKRPHIKQDYANADDLRNEQAVYMRWLEQMEERA